MQQTVVRGYFQVKGNLLDFWIISLTVVIVMQLYITSRLKSPANFLAVTRSNSLGTRSSPGALCTQTIRARWAKKTAKILSLKSLRS